MPRSPTESAEATPETTGRNAFAPASGTFCNAGKSSGVRRDWMLLEGTGNASRGFSLYYSKSRTKEDGDEEKTVPFHGGSQPPIPDANAFCTAGFCGRLISAPLLFRSRPAPSRFLLIRPLTEDRHYKCQFADDNYHRILVTNLNFIKSPILL